MNRVEWCKWLCGVCC